MRELNELLLMVQGWTWRDPSAELGSPNWSLGYSLDRVSEGPRHFVVLLLHPEARD